MVNPEKYVVLDVETNGLSSQTDDLLSLSIFDPLNKEHFDRFFPLELQSKVLTSEINGITIKDLKNAIHMNQDEFNYIIDKFDLKNRIILTYGNLDEHFVKSYLKRHHIIGFENLHFYNFKNDIISTAYSNGLLTKDNLCKAFEIEGVVNIHSGHNDCILEWKLFERLNGRKLFVTYSYDFCPKNVEHSSENWYIYEFNDKYVVPVSFLHTHPKLKKILRLPKIDLTYEKVFEYCFSKKCSPKYAYQPAGVASEHLIKTMLGACYQDNREFLMENKRKLKYLGTIIAPPKERVVLYSECEDGTLKVINKRDEKIINGINKQSIALKKEVGHVVDFIKTSIFKGNDILSQELVVNKDYNMLGLCDFSNQFGVLETKWIFDTSNKRYIDKYKYQLFITSNSRPMYIMVGSENNITIYNVKFSYKVSCGNSK